MTVRESGSAETIAMFEAGWGGTGGAGSLQYRGDRYRLPAVTSPW